MAFADLLFFFHRSYLLSLHLVARDQVVCSFGRYHRGVLWLR
jgi:hypothetical protein